MARQQFRGNVRHFLRLSLFEELFLFESLTARDSGRWCTIVVVVVVDVTTPRLDVRDGGRGSVADVDVLQSAEFVKSSAKGVGGDNC